MKACTEARAAVASVASAGGNPSGNTGGEIEQDLDEGAPRPLCSHGKKKPEEVSETESQRREQQVRRVPSGIFLGKRRERLLHPMPRGLRNENRGEPQLQ